MAEPRMAASIDHRWALVSRVRLHVRRVSQRAGPPSTGRRVPRRVLRPPSRRGCSRPRRCLDPWRSLAPVSSSHLWPSSIEACSPPRSCAAARRHPADGVRPRWRGDVPRLGRDGRGALRVAGRRGGARARADAGEGPMRPPSRRSARRTSSTCRAGTRLLAGVLRIAARSGVGRAHARGVVVAGCSAGRDGHRRPRDGVPAGPGLRRRSRCRSAGRRASSLVDGSRSCRTTTPGPSRSRR